MSPIKKTAIDFISSHWDEIKLEEVEITDTKQKFINRIKKQDELAWWVLTEVMYWGCERDYTSELIAETSDSGYWVLKIEDRYFQNDGTFKGKEVFPKTKTIIYFE